MSVPPHADRPPTPLERRSEPAVRAIQSLPPVVPVVVAVGLIALGLVLGRWGSLLLVLVSLVLGWFLLAGWRRLTPVERLMRAAVLLLILAAAVVRGLPR